MGVACLSQVCLNTSHWDSLYEMANKSHTLGCREDLAEWQLQWLPAAGSLGVNTGPSMACLIMLCHGPTSLVAKASGDLSLAGRTVRIAGGTEFLFGISFDMVLAWRDIHGAMRGAAAVVLTDATPRARGSRVATCARALLDCEYSSC